MANNVTYKVFIDKLGGTEVQDFIGQPGDLFYDPNVGELRLSDGSTPGGVNTTISSDASDDTARTIASAAFEKANALVQEAFVNIEVTGQNNNTIVASSNTDTLILEAGVGVILTTDSGNNTLTLTSSSIDQYSRDHGNAAFSLANIRAQNAFSSITIQGVGTLSAENNSDSVILSSGPGIALGGSDNTITIRALTNSFSTISVSGQSNVVADSNADTLTLVSGNGISITTNATTDTLTITASNTIDQFARDHANGAQALANLQIVELFNSAVATVAANVTGYQTLAVVTVPGGAMGANGWVQCYAIWTMDGSSNSKAMGIRALGPVSQIISALTATNHITYHQSGIIYNRGNTQQQISSSSQSTFYGPSSSANVNAAHTINTESDWTIYFSANKTSANERISLEQYRVEYQYIP